MRDLGHVRAPARVSVLVPTFNRARYLAECLDSILAQTLPAHEVLVIDDGSTDDTPRILRAYRDRIRPLRTPQLGKSGALNLGLQQATGDYIWCFDDDDVALPDALRRFVDPLARLAEYGFSYSRIARAPSRADGDRIGSPIHVSTIPDVRSRGFFIRLLENNFIGGAALFARRACYDAVGGFDTDLLRSQDYEMAIRISLNFKGIEAPGGPTFCKRIHAGMRGSRRDRFEHREQHMRWSSYDRLIFGQLYRLLSLDAFLPPGCSLEGDARRAYLQRMDIMSRRLLVDEVLQDLARIAELGQTRPLSAEERRMILNVARSFTVRAAHAADQSPHAAAISDYFRRLRRMGRESDCIRPIQRFTRHALLGSLLVKRSRRRDIVRHVFQR